MSMKKFALIALASTAIATPAFATDIDQLMKEINALKAKVNELSKKSAAAPAAAPAAGPVVTTVKACEAQGDGFIVIPGSTTCIKLGGYMRADGYGNQVVLGNRSASEGRLPEYNLGARYRLETDVRSSTPVGTLRGYARLNFDVAMNSYGIDAARIDINQAVDSNGNGQKLFTSNSSSFPTSVAAEYAYVSLGGFSAGVQNSAFDFYNQADTEIIKSDDKGRQLGASYTASLGSGLSVTGAVENPYTRSQSASTNILKLDSPDITKELKWGLPLYPDFIAALQYSQAPLTVKLSGAVHSNNAAGSSIVTDPDTNTPLLNAGAKGSGMGYAYQGGLKYVVSPDTTVNLQGTYANGAMSYLGYGTKFTMNTDVTPKIISVPGYTGLATNADFDPQTGADQTSHGWSTMAAVNQKIGDGTLSVIGSYGEITDLSDAGTLAKRDTLGKVKQVEVNYLYKPFAGFNIKPAVGYVDVDIKSLKPADDYNVAGLSFSQFRAKLSVWRDF